MDALTLVAPEAAPGESSDARWLWIAAFIALGELCPNLGWLGVGAVAGVGGLCVKRAPALGIALLSLAVGLAGSAGRARFLETTPMTLAEPCPGTVAEVTLEGERALLVVAPDEAPEHRVEVRLARRPPGLGPGARVLLHGPFRRFEPADNPGQPDALARATRRQVAFRAFEPVRLLSPVADSPLLRLKTDARAQLALTQRPEGAGLLAGLLLGDRALVPASAIKALDATGTSHLLSVSGLHVGGLAALVAALVSGLALRLGAVRPYRVGAGVALGVAWGYVALAQFPLAACRAGVMVTALLLGQLLGRTASGLNALGLAAVAVQVSFGGAILEPAFQLSFGAVAALLVFGRGQKGLLGVVKVSLVAALATAPIQAWHFGTAAPLSLAGNLLLTPFASWVLVPAGLLGLLLSPLTLLPLTWACAAAEGLLALGEALGELGGLVVVGAHWAFALAAPGCLLGLRVWLKWPLAALLCGLTAWQRPSGLLVDFVAVGQGDAILVRGGGYTYLVDTGPDPKALALTSFLRHEGVGRLDALYLTHGHPDHTGGALALAEQLPIGAVRFHGRWSALDGLVKSFTQKGIFVETARGEAPLGEGRLVVLSTLPEPDLSENDASLVLRVEGPAGAALLTGDLEPPGEAKLLRALAGPSLILKAPHHGSGRSSGAALLERATCLGQTAVVLTVGRDNHFHLPHPSALSRYEARGLTIFRTDLHGRIQVRLDGQPALEPLRGASVDLKTTLRCEVP